MPATLPVHERICAEMAGRLLTCTHGTGYDYEVAEVVRRRLGEVNAYAGGTVELVCDGFQRVDGSDEGTHPRVTWQMDVFVIAYVEAPANSSEGLDTTISRAERDILKALDIGDRFALADHVALSAADRFGTNPGDAAGSALTFAVQFVANETDLAVGRS